MYFFLNFYNFLGFFLHSTQLISSSFSDSPHVGNDEALTRLQDTLQQALSSSERSFQRCGQLLLAMPLLRHIASKAVQFFNDIRQSGSVSMHKLFAEMLDAKLWLWRHSDDVTNQPAPTHLAL